MLIGLFTHNFLEPTHNAVAQVLSGLAPTRFRIFAKRFGDDHHFAIPTVESRRLLIAGEDLHPALLDCDIIHSIYDGDTAFSAYEQARELRKLFMLSFHGGFDTNAKIFDARYRTVTRELCEGADVVTVITEADVRRLRSIGVTRPIHVVPVPVDPTACPPPASRDPYALCLIGRLVEKKGVDVALRALALLPPPYRLTIVGAGELADELVTLARQLRLEDRVSWKGLRSLMETLQLLNECGMLIHPARVASDGNADGIPQAILWAQVMRIPVISTTTGSIPDLIRHEHTGMLVQPEDPLALASVILQQARDPESRDRMVCSAATAPMLERCKLEAVVAEYRSLYRNALSSGPAPSGTRILPNMRAHERFSSDELGEILADAACRLGCASARFEYLDAGGEALLFVVRCESGQSHTLKIPASSDPAQLAILRQKLRREVRILNLVRTPRLPTYVSHDDAGRFVIRELLVGEPLSRLDRHAGVSLRLQVLADVFRLANELFPLFHQSELGQFVLRDLKARNIVASFQGEPVLRFIDLGAVLGVDAMRDRVWDHQRLGTGKWLHWSPEMLLGHADSLGLELDYFAFGVLAYQILMSRAPFSNNERAPERVSATYQAEFTAARNALQEHWLRHCPANVLTFIVRCLTPEPAGRPQRLPDLGGWLDSLAPPDPHAMFCRI